MFRRIGRGGTGGWGGREIPAPAAPVKYENGDAVLELESGKYEIRYTPNPSYIQVLSTYTPLVELAGNREARQLIAPLLPPGLEPEPGALWQKIRDASLRDLASHFPMEPAVLDELDAKLKNLSNHP